MILSLVLLWNFTRQFFNIGQYSLFWTLTKPCRFESIPFKLRKFACILSPKSSFLSSLSCLSGTSVIKMLRFLFWNFNYHLYSPINRWVYIFVFFVYYFFVPFIICFLLVPIFVSVFFFHVRYFINIKWFLALCSYLRLKQWMLIKAVCMCDEECRFLGFTVVW